MYGTRKCSKCKEFKMKEDFTKYEAKQTASKRVCNACGAPWESTRVSDERMQSRSCEVGNMRTDWLQ